MFFSALSTGTFPGQVQGPYGEICQRHSTCSIGAILKKQKHVSVTEVFLPPFVTLSVQINILLFISGGLGAGLETVGGKYGELWVGCEKR